MIDNGMQQLGFNYVNLDDCWADQRDTNGSLTWDKARFPSGMPGLASWLHERDFKFGLYTSAGDVTCNSGGRPLPIPGSKGHYDDDAALFAQWGVDYIKFDWCGDIHDQVWRIREAHVNFSAAVKKAGRPMFLEVVAGYWGLLDEISEHANAWRFCEDHKDSWKSTQEQVACRHALSNGTLGAPGGWAHMDFLHTGGAGCTPWSKGAHCPGQGDEEYRTTFALWSLTQSPLIVDTDVRVMTPVMHQTLLNKEIIDIHQSTKTPPGRHLANWGCKGTVLGAIPRCQIWARPLDSAVGASDWVVALVNWDEQAHGISATWHTLGWSSSVRAVVRDLWNRTDLPVASGQLSAEVPPHGTRLFRITAMSEPSSFTVSI